MLQRFIPVSALGLRTAPLYGSAVLLLLCACSGSDAAIIGPGATPASEPSTAIESNQPEPQPPEAPAPSSPGAAGAAGVEAPGAESPGTDSPGAKPPIAEPSSPSNEGNGGAPPLQPPVAGASATSPETPETPADPPPPPGPPVPPPARVCEPAEGELGGLQLTTIVEGLVQPTFVTAAPGDDSRLFVLEKTGAIRVVRDGQLLAEPFLDLSSKVSVSSEEGLVGLAFHPDYAKNGRFFVQYSLLDPKRADNELRQVVLSELTRAGLDPERADTDSERLVMLVEQPSDIHLAGMLEFGPDGMLYISRGDGGSNDSQDLESLLGKLLRIDVDPSDGEQPYGIPPGNLGDATGDDSALPEIWSYGWRNPWRFSFDACTGDMYVGDVGESDFEEIDIEPANSPGRNYGWRFLEGSECFDPETGCDPSAFTPPVLAYEHDFGCAVVSGFVYRGQRIPALRGTYLYADHCFGNFGSLRFEEGELLDARDITLDINPDDVTLITSFGEDNAGEMYVLSQFGTLYRVDAR